MCIDRYSVFKKPENMAISYYSVAPESYRAVEQYV